MFSEKKVLITRINASIFCAGVRFLTGSTINSWYNPSDAKKPLKQTEVTKRASLGRDKNPRNQDIKFCPQSRASSVPLLFLPRSAQLLRVLYSSASADREELQPEFTCPCNWEGSRRALSCGYLQRKRQHRVRAPPPNRDSHLPPRLYTQANQGEACYSTICKCG